MHAYEECEDEEVEKEDTRARTMHSHQEIRNEPVRALLLLNNFAAGLALARQCARGPLDAAFIFQMNSTLSAAAWEFGAWLTGLEEIAISSSVGVFNELTRDLQFSMRAASLYFFVFKKLNLLLYQHKIIVWFLRVVMRACKIMISFFSCAHFNILYESAFASINLLNWLE